MRLIGIRAQCRNSFASAKASLRGSHRKHPCMVLRLVPGRFEKPRQLFCSFIAAGQLLDEQGRSEAAIDCLRRALHAAPDYADAMFNLALLLQRGSRHKEAAEYWRQYLANDALSEWAARARRSLKFCEMQIHLSAC